MPDALPLYRPTRLKPPRKANASHYASASFRAARTAVLVRDCFTCRSCGRVVTQLPQVDHIVPIRHGGTDDLTNLQTLCLRCHGRKTVAEMATA
jgi:5-methylcytosine-specific restriction protein A